MTGSELRTKRSSFLGLSSMTPSYLSPLNCVCYAIWEFLLSLMRKIKEHSVIISIFLLMLISSSFGIVSLQFASGQASQVNSANATSLNVQNIPAKKVQVGDINIAYKTFGKGDPILLIIGLGSVMDTWNPTILRDLSSNHTVIIFDNRGVGNTTVGTKPFSIIQFANDTAGLLDALKIQKADVLGFSMGTFIAQQLTLLHPEKVNSTCS
jgi:alpha/beta hydrolase fold